MMGVRNIITIAMDQNKRLKIHSTGLIHQFESNADEMLILLPNIYDGANLSDCKIEIHYSNIQNADGVVCLDVMPEKYNDNYLKYSCKLPMEMALIGGKIPIRIECVNDKDRVRIISDTAYIDVVEIVKIDNDNLVQIAPVLAQWAIKMTQTHNHANEVLRQTLDQVNIATRAASLAVQALNEIKGGG